MTATTHYNVPGEQAGYTEPTYSYWRRPRTPGVFGQGLFGSVAVIGGVLVCVALAAFVSTKAGMVALAMLAVTVVPLVWKRTPESRTGGQRLLGWVAWRRQVASGSHLYRSGQLSAVPGGAHRLPGILGQVDGYEFTTGTGNTFGLLHNRRAGTWTVVLRARPQGSDLVDEQVLDERVAGWAKFLADTARIADLDSVISTVETVPDHGARLAAEVARLTSPQAPALARAALAETAAVMPTGQAALLSRVAVSFRTSIPAAKRNAKERPAMMADLISQFLPGLCSSLAAGGAGVCRAMTLTEVAEDTRAAYDPAVTERIEQARIDGRDSGVTWESCGPVGAVEGRGTYWHDGSRSITWAMEHAPLGRVLRTSLIELLRADAAVARKRVTLIFRPYSSKDARNIARSDIKTVVFERGKSDVGDAYEDAELIAARRTEEELARGAGLVRFALYVTATIGEDDDVDQAVAVVEQSATACDIHLRRVWQAQAAAFSVGLGLGVVPSHHVVVPAAIRDSL